MSSEQSDVRPGDADPLALFHRTLAELCRAEVPLPKAFLVLQDDLERGPVKDAAEALARDVENGVPLAEAYAARADAFPPTYRALVAAGMASGDLAGALEEIAEHAERRADAEMRVRRALSWPLLSAFAILLVAGGALLFALPRMWSFAEQVGGRSPAPIALGALGALGLLIVAMLWVAARRRPAQGAWAFALPVVGPLRLDALRTTVTSTLGVLLRRRLPLADALDLAAGTAGHPLYEERLRRAAAAAKDGASLGDALQEASLLEPAVLGLVRSAEAASEAESGLEDAARIYRRRLDRRLDRFTLIVKPVAELALGVIVFVFAFSYVVPLYDYASRIMGMD